MKQFSLFLCLFFLGFSSVFADYERNIDDEIKIHEFKVKLEKYLEKSKNGEEIKEKYRELISEKLGKTEKEVQRYRPTLENPINSFREYFLYYIFYSFLIKDTSDIQYTNYFDAFKVLENEYVRTIVRHKNLYLDDNGLYLQYQGSNKSYHLYFMQIDKDITLLEYLEKNIFEEKFRGKCIIKNNTSARMQFGKSYEGFYFEATEEYQKTYGIKEWADCGKYGNGVFTRMSNTLVFYQPWSTEYLGIDFSLIEIK